MKRTLIVMLSVLTLMSIVTTAFCVPIGGRVKLKGGYIVAASREDFHKLKALEEKENYEALKKATSAGSVYWTTEGAEVELVNAYPTDGTAEVQQLSGGQVVWTDLKAIGYEADKSGARQAAFDEFDSVRLQDPFEIGRKVAMTGKYDGTIWGKESESETHIFFVLYNSLLNCDVFVEEPKSDSGAKIMWTKYSDGSYEKSFGKDIVVIPGYEAEEAAWRILKHFNY